MKKLLPLLIILVIAISSCGKKEIKIAGDDKSSDKKEQTKSGETTEKKSESSDKKDIKINVDAPKLPDNFPLDNSQLRKATIETIVTSGGATVMTFKPEGINKGVTSEIKDEIKKKGFEVSTEAATETGVALYFTKGEKSWVFTMSFEEGKITGVYFQYN